MELEKAQIPEVVPGQTTALVKVTSGLEKISLPLAIMKFFGKLPGQTTLDVANEIKALTSKDKADLAEMFRTVGYEIEPPKLKV